jgi:hypothetical protein
VPAGALRDRGEDSRRSRLTSPTPRVSCRLRGPPIVRSGWARRGGADTGRAPFRRYEALESPRLWASIPAERLMGPILARGASAPARDLVIARQALYA